MKQTFTFVPDYLATKTPRSRELAKSVALSHAAKVAFARRLAADTAQHDLCRNTFNDPDGTHNSRLPGKEDYEQSRHDISPRWDFHSEVAETVNICELPPLFISCS
jgi:hypothetical protein